tara:strand:+ start:232 stop:852 length:621 start_codon:yes stop_codon:yes gene_type:complete
MKNNYHRFIDLPFDIPKPQRFETPARQFISYLGLDVVPDAMHKWAESHGLKVSNVVEGFYSGPFGSGVTVPIHTDQTDYPGVADRCKINVTWGPQDSVTRWYKLRKGVEATKIEHAKNYVNDGFEEAGIVPDIYCPHCWTANKNDLKPVFEKVISGPSLLNIGQLHSVFNPSKDQMRWTISFAILKDGEPLLFADALKIFDSCLTK